MTEPIRVSSTTAIAVTTQTDEIHITAGEIELELPLTIARHLALEILRNTFLYHQAAVNEAWASREAA